MALLRLTPGEDCSLMKVRQKIHLTMENSCKYPVYTDKGFLFQ